MEEIETRARRDNKNKLRYELIPEEINKELAKVFTIGAEKYTIRGKDGVIISDGANNWKKGLSWKETLGAVYRHLAKFEKGEDFDYDYPKDLLDKYGPSYHLANAAWGITVLLNYYKTHPELDDRLHKIPNPKIGLDIDDVLSDFINYYCQTFSLPEPTCWNFDRLMPQRLKELPDSFWLNMPCKTPANELPFEPHCYITARSIPIEITQAWLDKNDYPQVPLYCVPYNQSKVEVAKASGIDIFVDDKYENYVELNNAGICTYLFTAGHNTKRNVGYKRLNSLKDLLV